MQTRFIVGPAPARFVGVQYVRRLRRLPRLLHRLGQCRTDGFDEFCELTPNRRLSSSTCAFSAATWLINAAICSCCNRMMSINSCLESARNASRVNVCSLCLSSGVDNVAYRLLSFNTTYNVSTYYILRRI